MKVLLVNPPQWMYSGHWIHQNPGLGLLSLASVLRENHEVKVIDAEALRFNFSDLKGAIRENHPDVLGVTGTTLSFRSMVKTIKLAKMDNHELQTIIGGPHVSALPHKSLALSGADCAVIGEGELIIEKALTHKGLLYNEKPAVLDDLSFPARDLLIPEINSKWYTGNDPILDRPETTVMWQRGCPHRCNFCSHSVFGRRNRRRSPLNIVKELVQIRDRWGIKTLFVYDDELFGMNRSETKWCIEVCDEIIDFGLNVMKYKTQARCSKRFVTNKLLSRMRDAGFEVVMLGCESGSQRVLDAIHKNLKIEDIVSTVKRCFDHGFKVFTYWMIGNKTETVKDAQMTLDLMQKLAPYTHSKHVTILNPLPGSDIYREAMEEGWIINYDMSQWTQHGVVIMRGSWMSIPEILEWEQKLVEA